jgi:hypothetical protein
MSLDVYSHVMAPDEIAEGKLLPLLKRSDARICRMSVGVT